MLAIQTSIRKPDFFSDHILIPYYFQTNVQIMDDFSSIQMPDKSKEPGIWFTDHSINEQEIVQ